MSKQLNGSVVGVALVGIFGSAMLPLRSHLSISTAALVLVVPVVLGAVIGGFSAGIVSVACGFLVYDFFFIPPYGTFEVGAAENWAALIVYVIVMLLVARLVSSLEASRREALRINDTMRRLADLSAHLVGDQPVAHLLETIVNTAQSVFGLSGVSLLVLEEGRLKVAASAGEPLSGDELRRLDPLSGTPVSIGTGPGSKDDLRSIALSASGDAVGLLALRGLPASKADRAVLDTFANDAALALERAQLRDVALRTNMLEEVDRIRRGLLGAVSHDLRSPLATIKVASSTLSNSASELSPSKVMELYELIELEADRLTRLVSNLLDMTRIESGVLAVDRSSFSVDELIRESVTSMGTMARDHQIAFHSSDALPDVMADRLLIGQVLINLVDNALRHSPAIGDVAIAATTVDHKVIIAVTDRGPGVPLSQRVEIFNRFVQFDTGGRAGLGLTIAKTFVEAHGERIWYEDAPGGGAVFAFSLPIAARRSGPSA